MLARNEGWFTVCVNKRSPQPCQYHSGGPMSQQIRCQLWIAAAASVIFFINLGDAGLWDMDEALYTSCAREMFERGDWVVPWFNGQMFPEKPPLMFWTMIASFELFGVNELGARFFSAVMGVATALIAFHIGRLLFNVRVGFWTGLITASTIVFTISARAATVDCALTFVTTAAMLLFVMAKRSGLGTRGPGLGNHDSEDRGLGASTGGLGASAPSGGGECSDPESRTPNPDPPSPLYWPYAALMYACIGLAVLAKGPVGMVLPLAAIGLYMLIEGGPRRVFRSAWEMRPLTAMVVIAAVAAPWYVMVGQYNEGEWLRRFFFEFNLRPFRQPILGHGDTSSLQHAWAVTVSILYYFYHIPAILFGFFPWSVFLGPTLIHTYQCLRNKSTSRSHAPRGNGQRETLCVRDSLAQQSNSSVYSGSHAEHGNQDVISRSHAPRGNVGCVLAVCWFGVWLVFWSVCKTKLPHYLLPAYPALAMLTAWWIDRWLEKGSGVFVRNNPANASRISQTKTPDPFSARWPRNAWISTILTGLGITIAIPIVAAYYLPGEALIGLVGLIPLVGGIWCWRETSRGRNRQAMGVFAVMSVLFLTAVFGFAVLYVDRHQNAEPMIAAIQKDCKTLHPPIATYRFFRESTVYYAGRPVTRCEGDREAALKELADFLAKPGRSYVITTDRQECEIVEAFPGRLRVIFRHPRFLAPGEMVVLRRGGEDGGGSTKPDI